MKTKPGYSLRKVLDAYLVMGKGKAAYRPNCIMSMNETGAFLWHLMEQGAEESELVAALTAEYAVEAAVAAQDVGAFLNQLREKALIDE